MADYSKQWCDLNDPEMPHDFDIFEEHSKLETGYSVGIICEGFGTLGIAKGHNNEVLVLVEIDYPDNNDYVHWIEYDEFISDYKIKHNIA
jgi:hypothetical protein